MSHASLTTSEASWSRIQQLMPTVNAKLDLVQSICRDLSDPDAIRARFGLDDDVEDDYGQMVAFRSLLALRLEIDKVAETIARHTGVISMSYQQAHLQRSLVLNQLQALFAQAQAAMQAYAQKAQSAGEVIVSALISQGIQIEIPEELRAAANVANDPMGL